MAKQAKPKIKPTEAAPVKISRPVVKRVRCYCGTTRPLGTSCPMDHAAMAKASGQYLLATSTPLRLAYDKKADEYLGPPWTLKKLRTFQKLHQDLTHQKTLHRRAECPFCRTTTTWGILEYSGCLRPGCPGAMPS